MPVWALAVTSIEAFLPDDRASTIIQDVVLSRANPPYSSGTSVLKNPNSPISLKISRLKSLFNTFNSSRTSNKRFSPYSFAA